MVNQEDLVVELLEEVQDVELEDQEILLLLVHLKEIMEEILLLHLPLFILVLEEEVLEVWGILHNQVQD
tara:strand:+ start:317 stop:523 length:207 start_codon:yes stop_codon:yes gene_type:complete